MAERTNRREELLDAARILFAERGYDGTSVADLVEHVGMSKAAFGYHVRSKEDLLRELVEPLLSGLESVVERHPPAPVYPHEVRGLLGDYLDVLIRYRDIVVWVDGDKSVLNHEDLGGRLTRNSRRIRAKLTGGSRAVSARMAAASVLGALWRPIRNLPEHDPSVHAEAILDTAMAAAGVLRASVEV